MIRTLGGSAGSAASAAGRDAGKAEIRPLREVKRAAIEAAIAACDGNVTEAAHRLGISAKTIYRKRRRWLARP